MRRPDLPAKATPRCIRYTALSFFAGKPRSYGTGFQKGCCSAFMIVPVQSVGTIDIEKGALGALFLWAPDGLSSGSPAPP